MGRVVAYDLLASDERASVELLDFDEALARDAAATLGNERVSFGRLDVTDRLSADEALSKVDVAVAALSTWFELDGGRGRDPDANVARRSRRRGAQRGGALSTTKRPRRVF